MLHSLPFKYTIGRLTASITPNIGNANSRSASFDLRVIVISHFTHAYAVVFLRFGIT